MSDTSGAAAASASAVSAKKKRWLPIVSNPDLLNASMRSLGGARSTRRFAFCDVYGVDEDLLAMVPQPCLAVTLLFPITDNYETFKEKQVAAIAEAGQTVSPKVYFMRQTVGNACGTIALCHSLLNNHELLDIEEGSGIDLFRKRTLAMDPVQRAQALGDDEHIASAHQDSAAGSGWKPDDRPEDVKVDTHFIAFVCVDGSLYELDGRKPFPINHGPCTQGELLQRTANVVREKFFALDPTNLMFNIMALAHAD